MGRIGKLIKTEIQKFIIATVETRYKYNQSVDMYSASGDDAPPLKDDRVLAVETDGTGNYAGAGVLMKSQGAKAGERFVYSRDENGNVKAIVKLLKDGSVQVQSKGGKIYIGNDNGTVFELLKKLAEIVRDLQTFGAPALHNVSADSKAKITAFINSDLVAVLTKDKE